jgi:uncharacterized protein YciI
MDLSDVIPAEFDVLTVVFLMRGPEPRPELSGEDLDRLQAEHLAYLHGLGQRGLIVANGPLTDQSDESMRGISVYSVGADEALALARADPMVRAGRLQAQAARWWTAAGKVSFPLHPTPVAQRLAREAMG